MGAKAEDAGLASGGSGEKSALAAEAESCGAAGPNSAGRRLQRRRPRAPRPAIAACALAFWPALFLLDIGWALVRGWSPESTLDVAAIAAAGFAVGALAAAVCVPRVRAALGRLWAPSVLAAISLGVTWLVAEVGLRAFAPHRLEPPFHCRWPNVEIAFDPDPSVMPGLSGIGWYRTNSRGLRGPEMLAEGSVYRILCLGGSTTECGYLDETETWPHLLSERLNNDGRLGPVWVNDAGISGYSSRHHARFAATSDLMNDINCLVVLVGVNDLTHFLETEQLSRDVAAEEQRQEARRPLWTWTAVRQLALGLVHQYLGGITHQNEDLQGHNYQLRREERQTTPQSDLLPPLDAALADYRHQLVSIVESCRAKGVRLIFVTQPVLWKSQLGERERKLLWLGWTKDGSYLTPGRLREAMDRFNRTLVNTCRENGVELVDLAPLDGDPAIFYDDCHFTEVGAARVAEEVAEGVLAPPR